MAEYPAGSTVLFWMFLFYVAYWYLQMGYRFPVLGAIRLEFILGSFLTVVAAFSYFGRSGLAGSSLYGWTALLFLCMALQVPFSHDLDTSWDIFVDRVIKFAMMALFITAFVRTPRRLWWFLAVFMLACMRMGLEGFIGTITGSLIWENQGIPRLHGPTPNYAHPNSFAGNALGTLPFIFYFLPVVSRQLKLALLAQGALAFNVILFTGSRTGYVAFAVGAVCLVLQSRSRKKAVIWTVFLGIVLLPVIPQDYIERVQTIFSGEDKEGGSIEARKTIIEDAWEIFWDHPLGIGVGAFPAVRQLRFGRSQDTHNLYLEVATNVGIQGLLVFLLLVFAMLRTLRKLRRDFESQYEHLQGILAQRVVQADGAAISKHMEDLKVFLSTCRAVTVFVVIRLVLGLFGMDLYEIYWWFALGLTLALLNLNLVSRARMQSLRLGVGADPGVEPSSPLEYPSFVTT